MDDSPPQSTPPAEASPVPSAPVGISRKQTCIGAIVAAVVLHLAWQVFGVGELRPDFVSIDTWDALDIGTNWLWQICIVIALIAGFLWRVEVVNTREKSRQ